MFSFSIQIEEKNWFFFQQWYLWHFLSCDSHLPSCFFFTLFQRWGGICQPGSHSRFSVVAFQQTFNIHFWKSPVSQPWREQWQIPRVLEMVIEEKKLDQGILWANDRTVLGFASPRVDPPCSLSCLEICGLLALLVGYLLVWFKFRLKNFSQASLFPGKSVFLGLKKKRKIEKHTSLPGFCAPTPHCATQEQKSH